MISDSIYFQGKHFSNPELPCQDYALDAEKEDGYGIIVISDGCSSAQNTDLGARILSHLAITELKNNRQISPHLIFTARQILSSLGFTKKEDIYDALCATLLTAEEKENEIETNCRGDGIICAQYEDYFHVINLEYLDNAPYYLVYDAFPELKEEYQKSYSQNIKFVSSAKFKVKDFEKFIYSNSFNYDYLEILESKTERLPYHSPFSFLFPKNGLQKILLTSDGLQSFEAFVEGKREEIILERILVQILNSWKKNSYGALSRRMVYLKKKWEELRWKMNDDLAVGCLMRGK
jgi:hypothetical protein